MKRKRTAAATKTKTAIRAARSHRVVSQPKTAGPRLSDQGDLEIPPLLLEGDQPPAPPVSGPGWKFALGATPSLCPAAEAGALPEAYGTKRLLVTARDPHWLYVHWDLASEQQRQANARSAEGHLVLRIFTGGLETRLMSEVHVHPESRHWFVHVARGATPYRAELGYYRADGQWIRVSVSDPTFTPPEEVASETAAEFATIPPDVPLSKLLATVKATVRDNFPLARALEGFRRAGHPELPSAISATLRHWTAQQEAALARMVSVDPMRRVWLGSLEITELVRRRLARESSSPEVSAFGGLGVSSPLGAGASPARGFWFTLNAELVIYGATEPTARVTLHGREVRLRPDGSFSFRFALPDGAYALTARAVSADGAEARAAELRMSRETIYQGEVGAHPQDPTLKAQAPAAINL